MQKTAIISGASGLVGNNLLNLLLNSKKYKKVYCLVRKELAIQHPNLEQIIFDYNNDNSYLNLPKADEVFCCLGTTIKNAGSQKAFKKVDLEYPLKLAKAVLKKEAKAYHVITALGASSDSNIFYNKVKGELEDELKKLKFEQLYIYRPSLLLGNRKEQRLGEKFGTVFMKSFNFLMQGSLKKYRAIQAEDVAKAMLYAATNDLSKLKIILSDEIQALADNYTNK